MDSRCELFVRLRRESFGMGFSIDTRYSFTPLRIQNAQWGSPFSLITAHKVGVLNEKMCNTYFEEIMSRITCGLFGESAHTKINDAPRTPQVQ
jgi:hypothetical protein